MDKTSFIDNDANAIVNPNMKVHPNPAPKKMARAIEFFEKNGLPPQVKQTKKRAKPPLSTLQTELLTIYDFEPSEKKMAQLKDFLQQLFIEELNQSKAKQEAAG